MVWDLITIGGGAAGFFGAITHAERGGGSTLILENSASVLTKVRISGGGRCNVTHDCHDARELSKSYPRGEKALIGPLHRWGTEDTVGWFTSRGVNLKAEPDGRMFPTTDRSQTIIDCLETAARLADVEVRTNCGVVSIQTIDHADQDARFEILTESGERLSARNILLATGGTRQASGARLAEQLGHSLEPAVPSLFTFKIADSRIAGLQGLSVLKVEISIEGTKLKSTGPLLITHWGMSGPGILRLSAWGARLLADQHYCFRVRVNWLPDVDAAAKLQTIREQWGKRQLHTKCPFPELPRRLWMQLLAAAGVGDAQLWAQLTRKQAAAVVDQLSDAVFEVTGKSLNKEEFVTCGGVPLNEIDMKTMESKRCASVYFAGEIMNVDGVTGGFNFQNAWTTGHHAGSAIAARN